LAEESFGDLSLRCFEDLDVLVRANQVSRAIAVAAELGYKEAAFADHPHWRDTGWHHAALEHPERAPLELHWALFPPRFHTIDDDLPWRNSETSAEQNSVPGFRFSPALTLVHLACHFVQHDFQIFR